MTKREVAVTVAWKMWGLPYLWGGDDPMAGFDCSGMSVEILKSVGELPHEGDWTANDLYLRYRDRRVDTPREGCLVFYGSASKITHVEFCLDESVSIGASGGGSSTTDLADAIRQNAYIKVRPIRRRNDIVGYADPFREAA
jgi:cell wall-associated NlpC family hydrolase